MLHYDVKSKRILNFYFCSFQYRSDATMSRPSSSQQLVPKHKMKCCTGGESVVSFRVGLGPGFSCRAWAVFGLNFNKSFGPNTTLADEINSSKT